MTCIIAIKSCKRDLDLGCHEAIRQTWGQISLPVRFFVGNGTYEYLQGDEIVVDAPDDYMNLPMKTKKICEWFNGKAEHLYLADNDTFIRPEKFTVPWEDYAGCMNRLCDVGKTAHYRDHMGDYPNCHPWASGGIGYFLSKRAAQLVAKSTPNVWAEDLWVGQVLGPEIQAGRMTARHLENFNEVAAWHFRRTRRYRSYNPEMMYRSWALGNPNKMYEQDKDI